MCRFWVCVKVELGCCCDVTHACHVASHNHKLLDLRPDLKNLATVHKKRGGRGVNLGIMPGHKGFGHGDDTKKKEGVKYDLNGGYVIYG